MHKFKEKTQGFIIGLMVGLIIAGGFFMLKLDSYFKELSIYKSIIHTFTSESKSPETVDNKDKEENDKKSNESDGNTKSKSYSANDSTKNKNSTVSISSEKDSLKSIAGKDSLVANTDETDDIVVKKDELVADKIVDIINLNPVASRNLAKDSLMQKVSGVIDDKNASKQLINIEYWQSPLNYKGYKMSKYKLVLYGIASEDEIKVFKLDDNYYLKSSGTVYKLDYTGDFHSFDRVSDEVILNILK
jgi:hypothetical protein